MSDSFNSQISFFSVSAERKYFGSACSSKISDNEHPFPILRDAEILAVKHLPLKVIPQFIKRGDDGLESSSSVVVGESFDVLKENKARLLGFEYSCDFKKESASGVVEPPPFSSHAESLARESSTEHVEVWEFVGIDFGDVSIVLVCWKMFFINFYRILVYFAEPHALMLRCKQEKDASEPQQSRSDARQTGRRR